MGYPRKNWRNAMKNAELIKKIEFDLTMLKKWKYPETHHQVQKARLDLKLAKQND